MCLTRPAGQDYLLTTRYELQQLFELVHLTESNEGMTEELWFRNHDPAAVRLHIPLSFRISRAGHYKLDRARLAVEQDSITASNLFSGSISHRHQRSPRRRRSSSDHPTSAIMAFSVPMGNVSRGGDRLQSLAFHRRGERCDGCRGCASGETHPRAMRESTPAR